MKIPNLENFPKLIQDLVQFDIAEQAYPLAKNYEQIVNSNLAFMPFTLPFQYNTDSMLTEAIDGFKHYNQNYNNNNGWSSITLHGPKNITNEEFNKIDINFDLDFYNLQFDYTDESKKFINCVKWIENLKQYIDVNLVTIKRLRARSYIYPHTDTFLGAMGLRKIYMALNYPQGTIFGFYKKGRINLQPGQSFLLNVQSSAHYVVNTSDEDRYIIQAQTYSETQNWKSLVEQQYKTILQKNVNAGRNF